MATPMALGRLPFLASLSRSDLLQDRLLWLRVALDCAAELGEAAEFDDLFLERFVETLDRAGPVARIEAARRLARAPNPAAGLLSLLAAYGGEATDEILIHAPYLPRDVLSAALGDASQARRLANRDDLAPETIDALLATGDIATLKSLATNASVILNAESLAKAVRMARHAVETSGDRSFAEALFARWPNRPEMTALFLYASPAQRASLLLTAQRAELGRRQPSDRPDVASPCLEELEAHALAGRARAFSETLAKALECAPEMAERIAADRSGEALVVALVALGAPGDVAVRILTSSDLRDGADYRRVGALARLQDSLGPAAARRILGAMIDGPTVIEAETAGAPASGWRAGDRRPRPAAATLREDPASVRRRRAFALLAENRKL